MFYFPVKRALKIDQLQTAVGQFAYALLQLLTLLAGQLWYVKINIQFCSDNVLFSVKRVLKIDQQQTAIPVNLQMHFLSCWPFWQDNSGPG